MKRFFIGFSVAALVAVLGLSITDASIEEALAFAALIGVVAGILSMFGKKILRLVMTFFSELF